MFLRIKKRINPSGKTYEYAYWVANKYRKRRQMPKQKVKQYLGRVYRFEKVMNNEIEQITDKKASMKTKIMLLIENELKNYGFEEKQGICINDEGKNISIAINEGVLHQSTINALISFKPKEGLEKDIGKQLGNALISAGIRPKEAVFIDLCKQIIAQVNNHQQSSTMSSNAKQ